MVTSGSIERPKRWWRFPVGQISRRMREEENNLRDAREILKKYVYELDMYPLYEL